MDQCVLQWHQFHWASGLLASECSQWVCFRLIPIFKKKTLSTGALRTMLHKNYSGPDWYFPLYHSLKQEGISQSPHQFVSIWVVTAIPQTHCSYCSSSKKIKIQQSAQCQLGISGLVGRYLHLLPFFQVRGLCISSVATGQQHYGVMNSPSSLLLSSSLHSALCLLLELFAQLFPSLTAFIPDERRSLHR